MGSPIDSEKFSPLRVRARRNSDFLWEFNEKIGIDRSAAVVNTLICAVEFPILSLPPETRLYLCRDYQPGGRPPAHVSTVAEQRAANIHVHDGVTEQKFVAKRRARDATLAMPTLILPSVQVNMRAGQLPPPEDNGVRYLKIPLNVL